MQAIRTACASIASRGSVRRQLHARRMVIDPAAYQKKSADFLARLSRLRQRCLRRWIISTPCRCCVRATIDGEAPVRERSPFLRRPSLLWRKRTGTESRQAHSNSSATDKDLSQQAPCAGRICAMCEVVGHSPSPSDVVMRLSLTAGSWDEPAEHCRASREVARSHCPPRRGELSRRGGFQTRRPKGRLWPPARLTARRSPEP